MTELFFCWKLGEDSEDSEEEEKEEKEETEKEEENSLILSEFEESFARIHRNALVAKKYITGIHKDNEGRSFVTLRDCDKTLEISRRHLSGVKKLIMSL